MCMVGNKEIFILVYCYVMCINYRINRRFVPINLNMIVFRKHMGYKLYVCIMACRVACGRFVITTFSYYKY